MLKKGEFQKIIFELMGITLTQVMFFVLFCGIAIAHDSHSQEVLNTPISLKIESASVKTILSQIEKQTKIKFVYSNMAILSERKISVNIENERMGKILSDLLNPINISFELIDNRILLRKTNFLEIHQLSTSLGIQLPLIADITIKGSVTDEKGEKLPGANIRLKGTTRGATTDGNGAFSIVVPNHKSVLIFSSQGYKTVEVEVGTQTLINVILSNFENKLDEVVVVGYGSQKKATTTAAIASINTVELTNIPTSNLSNVLAGRASGVFVQSGTGLPGQPSGIRIRSPSSWNSTGPLIVVDGIQRDQSYFNSLDPNQVKDISILKDAASAAIYGSRSSDGVILITTKTGKKSKPQVQWNSVFGVASAPAIDVSYMPLLQSIDIYNNLPGSVPYNDYVKDYIRKNNPDGNLHVNEAYQKPSNQRHTLNVSGGDDNINYFIGGSFYDEKGFLPQVNYTKYNLRANIEAKLSKSLTLGLNYNFNSGDTHTFALLPGISDTDLSGWYEKLKYIMSPVTPAYIDGKPVATTWITNPIEAMKNGGYHSSIKQYSDAIINLTYKVPYINGLSVKGIANLYSGNDFIKSYGIAPTLYKFKQDPNSGSVVMYTNELVGTVVGAQPNPPYIGNENGKTSSYQLDAIVNYDTLIGNHHFNIMGVYETLKSYYTYSSLYKYNFPVLQSDQLGFGSQNPSDTKASGYETYLNDRVSYVGRVNYQYSDKYLFSASLRVDGSYKFSPENRWGYFPAVSVGWVLSKENFLLNNNTINFLKVRASYGTTGNDNVPAWMFQDSYTSPSTPYYFGPGAVKSILAFNGIGNKDYTWETSKSYNVGVDIKMLKNWNLTADFWTKNTYNILGQRLLQTPIEFGTSYPIQNYGKMSATGLDFEIAYNGGKIGRDFKFNIRANFGLATTNVLARDAALGATPAENPVGKPLNYAVGYHDTGIIRSDADLAKLPAGYTIFGAKPQKGMMNFQDVSGPNGKPDGIIDDYDKVVVAQYAGSNNAPITYGLNLNLSYKNFSIGALFGGLAGFKVIYNDPWGRSGGFPFLTTYYQNSYSDSNPDGTFPKIFPSSSAEKNGYAVVSGLNTFSGDFVRLKNLNVAYNVPQPLLKKLGISSMQFFTNATNLLSIRTFKIYDPESYGFGSYPVMATVSLGFNLQF